MILAAFSDGPDNDNVCDLDIVSRYSRLCELVQGSWLRRMQVAIGWNRDRGLCLVVPIDSKCDGEMVQIKAASLNVAPSLSFYCTICAFVTALSRPLRSSRTPFDRETGTMAQQIVSTTELSAVRKNLERERA